MKSKNRLLLLQVFFCVVLAISNVGCGGGSPSTLPISVTVSPLSATVQAASTQQFTATLTNDPQNKGVAWTVSCSPSARGMSTA